MRVQVNQDGSHVWSGHFCLVVAAHIAVHIAQAANEYQKKKKGGGMEGMVKINKRINFP